MRWVCFGSVIGRLTHSTALRAGSAALLLVHVLVDEADMTCRGLHLSLKRVWRDRIRMAFPWGLMETDQEERPIVGWVLLMEGVARTINPNGQDAVWVHCRGVHDAR